MTENNSLKKCSRCRSTLLLQYFSKNRKGDYFKCCDNCRNKNRKITPTDITPSLDCINKARSEFIQTQVDNSNGEIVYVGQVDPNDINLQHYPPLSRNDEVIEYHAFELGKLKIPMFTRWRYTV